MNLSESVSRLKSKLVFRSFRQKLIVFVGVGLIVGLFFSTYIAFLTINETEKRFAVSMDRSFRTIMDDFVKTTVRNTALWMEFSFGEKSHRLLDPKTMDDVMDQTQVTMNTFSCLTSKEGKIVFLDKDGIPMLDFKGKDVLKGQASLFECTNIDFKTLVEKSTKRLIIQKIPDTRSKMSFTVATIGLPPMNLEIKGQKIIGKDLILCVLVPANEIYGLHADFADELQGIKRLIVKTHIGTFCFLLCFVFIIYLWIFKKMAHGISALAKAVKQMEGKNYAVRVEVKSEDEVGVLAHSFNQMAQDIQGYTENLELKVKERTGALESASKEILKLNERLKQENLRLGAEVVVARQLQMMVLPRYDELAEIPNLDIVGFMQPADEVGGDYYDVMKDPDRKFVKIGIGDVTGHGLESGVVMLMVQTIAKTLLESGIYDPILFFKILNRVICDNNGRIRTEKNLTLLFADFYKNKVIITGQHEEVILVRKGGCIERIDTMNLGFPIGLLDSIEHFTCTKEVVFEPGDVMIFYTDGIPEAENEIGEQYGIDRFCASIAAHCRKDVNGIRDGVVRDVFTFIGKQDVLDDITLLIVKNK